jgi:hypothetical protein
MGLPQMLASLLSMQAREYDPELPVFVDQRNEKTASCANLIRQTYLQSCGLKNYTEAQKTMLLTPDLHAWILIRELRDTFGYEQSHADLMNYFDLSAFHSFMPIQSSKRKAYDKRVLDLYRFLHDAAQPGTIVPMYFQGSQSKGLVMKAYRQNDPHLNTHQTMFAGNMDWSVRAQDIPQIIDGKRMRAREESPHRNLIDTLIDFIADRADFRSSFLPQFRQTVLQGLARYPEMIHLEVR